MRSYQCEQITFPEAIKLISESYTGLGSSIRRSVYAEAKNLGCFKIKETSYIVVGPRLDVNNFTALQDEIYEQLKLET